MNRFFGRLVGALAAAAVLLSSIALGDFQKGVVNAEDVTLRERASAESASLEKLPRGAVVTVSGFEDAWFKVEYGERSGFVKQDQLMLKSVASEVASSGKVLRDDVNIRTKPSIGSSIVTQLKKDTVVEVTEKIDNWYKITSGKNKGYVQAEYVVLTEEVPYAPAFNTLKMGMSGKEVADLQNALKALNYFKSDVGGSYGAVTRDAVKAFQENNKLLADGVATPETQQLLFLGEPVPAAESALDSGVEAVEWAEADKLFAMGAEAVITDVRTGAAYSIRRVRGVSHAEVEPATAADCEALLQLCGGEWSQDVRPVIVEFSGRKIAAAIRPFPRGKDPGSDNAMDGTLSMHFKGSVATETRRTSPPFQAAITEALKSGVTAAAVAIEE